MPKTLILALLFVFALSGEVLSGSGALIPTLETETVVIAAVSVLDIGLHIFPIPRKSSAIVNGLIK